MSTVLIFAFLDMFLLFVKILERLQADIYLCLQFYIPLASLPLLMSIIYLYKMDKLRFSLSNVFYTMNEFIYLKCLLFFFNKNGYRPIYNIYICGYFHFS